MAFTPELDKFQFDGELTNAFSGRRVLITGAGRDGGIGQALAMAAALNGAEVVGVHFHSSYRDGFDLVEALRGRGVKAFALQADVTNVRDLWATRSYVIEQMGGKAPDLVICNSGLTEDGYRFGRALPAVEEESAPERRARARQAFLSNLEESHQVMSTKIDGFVGMTHLWAAEAVYHGHTTQFLYISSRQAIDPGVAVPGYVIANWAVLQLPKVLQVNLGRSANMASGTCLMLPFVRTGMTEAYVDNEKVFGRWQPRMLEPYEAARAVTQLVAQPAPDLNLGNYELLVEGSAEATTYRWSGVELDVQVHEVEWSGTTAL